MAENQYKSYVDLLKELESLHSYGYVLLQEISLSIEDVCREQNLKALIEDFDRAYLYWIDRKKIFEVNEDNFEDIAWIVYHEWEGIALQLGYYLPSFVLLRQSEENSIEDALEKTWKSIKSVRLLLVEIYTPNLVIQYHPDTKSDKATHFGILCKENKAHIYVNLPKLFAVFQKDEELATEYLRHLEEVSLKIANEYPYITISVPFDENEESRVSEGSSLYKANIDVNEITPKAFLLKKKLIQETVENLRGMSL